MRFYLEPFVDFVSVPYFSQVYFILSVFCLHSHLWLTIHLLCLGGVHLLPFCLYMTCMYVLPCLHVEVTLSLSSDWPRMALITIMIMVLYLLFKFHISQVCNQIFISHKYKYLIYHL